MKRRQFLQKTSLAIAGGIMVNKGFATSAMDTQRKKKLTVGAHVWVYASKQPKRDVSPILEQIVTNG